MPNNRRLPRTFRNVDPSMIPGFIGESRYATLGGAKTPSVPILEQPPAPKHFPSPNIPVESDVFFEFLIFSFTTICAGLQFVHLYRTVWWTPNSHINQTLSFYLIDSDLVAFIIILLLRRPVYLVGTKIIDILIIPQFVNLVTITFRIVLTATLAMVLALCTYRTLQKSSFMNIFYLSYPVLVYFVLFGIKILPFFELVDWDVDSILPPLHACTSTPSEIRNEVEKLKTNFNNRLKQILFSSLINAYYAGFIPCCFAQNFVYYDISFATQHTLFIFMSSFVAYCCHILHPRYSDILHRSALHSGNWEKMETRNMLLVNNKWNEDTLFPHGVLVRYGKDVYRALGECNASEPGCSAYSRFYTLFKNPSDPLSSLLIFHAASVFFQLYKLISMKFWYSTISLTFILFFNYYLLYKLLRDYLVSSNVYREERMLHKKTHGRATFMSK